MVEGEGADRVARGRDVLTQDLRILELMATGIDAYLRSDATWWDMGRKDMPLLTIGGYLMRRRRLGALSYVLDDAERESMAAANAVYDATVSGQIVRFEGRALTELGARMREWTVYLRDLAVSRRLAADTARYEYLADTRVVIDELITTLSASPFRLPDHLPADVAALDRRLGGRWTPGAFIWSPVWTPAYSPERYWWLYGYPAP